MVAKERKQMKHRSCVEEKKVKMKKVRKKIFLKDFEKIKILLKITKKMYLAFSIRVCPSLLTYPKKLT